MYTPTATYRIQLHKGFNFSQLADILPYLFELGISTIYASPVTGAVRGSEHGYDVTDPLDINPEIGTAEQWESITGFLKEHGMGWLQDIVPNHMAYSPENAWIFDVLERGLHSEFYSYFDIIPQHPPVNSRAGNRNGPDRPGSSTSPTIVPQTATRIMLPFLAEEPEHCIAAGEIKTGFNGNGFYFQYQEQIYPAAIRSYNRICSIIPGWFQPLLAWSDKTESFALLPWQEWIHFRKHLLAEVWNNKRLRSLAGECCNYINQDPALLRELLMLQHYELCSWKTSFSKMNYRRFFAVNSLICLRMEDANVFNNWHPLLMSLYHHQFIQGFRVDHIDGLFNPGAYLRKLRDATGPEAYLISEKILQENEETIPEWPVQGTTGYDFLSFANELLIHSEGREKLEAYFKKKILNEAYENLVFEAKRAFLQSHLRGEISNLMRWLEPLTAAGKPPVEQADIREALMVLMAAFPVYRIYADRLPLSETDRQWVQQAFLKAFHQAPSLKEPLDWLLSLFNTGAEEEAAGPLLYFLQRWAQFTAPLAAKGTEDTVFYRYNVLISQNEVGDSPGHTPVTAEKFHALMTNRQQKAALSLNAGSTHDTKRGEDSRVRISLISLFADEWIDLVEKWKQVNQPFVHVENNRRYPSLNDEYLIYQTLVGAIPEDCRITIGFRKRFSAWLTKALREEKQETTWEEPDMDYENHCQDFLTRILFPAHDFLASFLPFAKKIVSGASVFSLTQTILKLTAPGIPDIYQGSECWDLSLVDPDNRLPVDFGKRESMLKAIIACEKESTEKVLDYTRLHAEEGAQKLFLIYKLLKFRRQFPDLFVRGLYLPAISTGSFIGYIRSHAGQQLLILAPLPSAGNGLPVSAGITGRWNNILTNRHTEIGDSADLRLLLTEFPVAALVLEND